MVLEDAYLNNAFSNNADDGFDILDFCDEVSSTSTADQALINTTPRPDEVSFVDGCISMVLHPNYLPTAYFATLGPPSLR